MVEGKIQTRTWDDRETGQKKYRTEILINDLTLLGGGREENGRSGPNGRSDDTRRANGNSGQQPRGYSDEELNPGDIPV